MLKREITYEDFEGDEQTEVFYFNISKDELLEMEVEEEKGFGAFINKIIETKDKKELIAQFKRILLMSYGKKSDDGKRFIKNEQLREEFSQSAAYQTLFMELATDDKVAADFLLGIMPKDMRGGVKKAIEDSGLAPSAPTPPATQPT